MPPEMDDDADVNAKSFEDLLGLLPPRPSPINLATATANDPDPDDDAPGGFCYTAGLEYRARSWMDFEVTPDEHRLIVQHQAARERQAKAETACAAARWAPPLPAPPPREPAPEDISPQGKLTPRQEEFARHYAAQPVATRAAALAGFAESNAGPYGSRLLKNPLVLERIAQLRAEHGLSYVLERDTMHDKLEAVFFEALGERNHAAAVAAIKLQATLADMFARPRRAEAADSSETNRPSGTSPHAARSSKPTGKPSRKPTKAKVEAKKAKVEAKKSQTRRRQKPIKAKRSQ